MRLIILFIRYDIIIRMRLFEYIRYVQEDIFSSPLIGIDISDASIHFVKAARHFAKHPTIEWFLNEPIPSGLVVAGEIKQEKELSEVIRKAILRIKRAGTHSVVGALPEEKAFIKAIQVPYSEKSEELHNAIRFEAETSIPLSAAEMYLDYEDVTPRTLLFNHRDIIVVAYPRAVVDSYARVLRGAGLRIFALELESQGIVRALIDPTARDGAILCVDIGRTKAGFITYSEGSILFTSTVPIGGRDFEKAIQDGLSVSATEAEKLKKKIGLSKKEMGGRVFRALEPLVSIIIDEAEKNINFFERHSRHGHGMEKNIKKIVLCGGDSHLSGVIELIAERTKVPVELGRSLAFFSNGSRGSLLEHDSLSFTTALGLALRGIR